MKYPEFAEKMLILRNEYRMSQKEFAAYLDIPQPTLSSYESGRNAPIMEALINIAVKCSVSLDWLCGLSTSRNSISSISDIADFFYKLYEFNEIGGEIEIHDHLPNDLETETNKWYTRITFYGNDKQFPYNADLCNAMKDVYEHTEAYEHYAKSKADYESAKAKTKEYYSRLPLTKRELPELSDEERRKRHIEYVQAEFERLYGDKSDKEDKPE